MAETVAIPGPPDPGRTFCFGERRARGGYHPPPPPVRRQHEQQRGLDRGASLHTRGFATLCFNFRGVNRSTGRYGGGEAEVADVVAALDFLRARTPGPHFMVGYSFGAFVVGRALLRGLWPRGPS